MSEPQRDVQQLIAKLREHARACHQRAESISSGYKSMPWSERARDIATAADLLESLGNELETLKRQRSRLFESLAGAAVTLDQMADAQKTGV